MVFIQCPIAQVMDIDLNDLVGNRSLNDAGVNIGMKDFRKYRKYFKMHSLILSLRKPLGKLFLGIIIELGSTHNKRLLDVK